MSGIEWLDRVRQDIGYAVRGLRRSPGFTLAVALTLGLGLGVNAAMFSFLDSVFVKPPAAVAAPNQVRRLYFDGADHRPQKEANGRMIAGIFRYPQIREMVRTADSGVQLGVFTSERDSTTIAVGANLHSARRIIANRAYFDVLGVHPALGRFFDATEDRIETPARVAVISHDLWQRAFHGDAQAIGATFTIDDRPVTVVGVAPDHFVGIELDRSDFWMPLGNYDTDPPRSPPWYDSFNNSFNVVTRLPTVTIERRFTEVATRAYRTVHMRFYIYDSTALVRTGSILSAVGPAKPDQELSVSLRLGGVALIVLLIALANVSNLLLVRATKREREIAIRRALGVTRGRLLEQLFTESLLLALIGGGSALLLAFWVGTALRRLLLPTVAWATGALDLRTVVFAAVATLVAGLLVGLAPAVYAWRPDVVASLKAGSRGAGYRRSRLRSALLIAQAALSIVLLVGAGLFVRSLRNVHAVDLGYDVDRTLIAYATSFKKPDPSPAVAAAMPAILERLAMIPGVESVASSTIGPMEGERFQRIFLPGVDTLPEVGGVRGASYVNVSPDYFKAVGIRVVAGRTFSAGDTSGMVVGRALANAYWPGQSPIGKCIILDAKEKPCIGVVGVVEDVHRYGVTELIGARYYLAGPAQRATVVGRAAPDRQAAVAKLIESEMKRVVPSIEGVRVRSMSANLEREFRPWRLGATLFTAMGLLALIVTAVGVYSVIAYAVGQRTNEMGIRVALGAQVADIARLVVGEGLRTVIIGVVLGLVISAALGRLIASLLFGVSVRDPLVMTLAAAVLLIIGMLASIIPALRAARVDPATALRVD